MGSGSPGVLKKERRRGGGGVAGSGRQAAGSQRRQAAGQQRRQEVSSAGTFCLVLARYVLARYGNHSSGFRRNLSKRQEIGGKM